MALEGKKIYWDELSCEEALLKDIDKVKVKEFLHKAKRERRFDIDPDISIKEALQRLGLIRKGN